MTTDRMDETPPDFDHEAPALRTYPLPRDLNGNGDVFGGWVMSQMDLAGAGPAMRRARGRIATVGVEAMKFHRPVSLGDEVNFYARIDRTGTTSIRMKIDVWVRKVDGVVYKVTEGVFTYVAIGEDGRSRPLPPG